jgi:hypothetical protein
LPVKAQLEFGEPLCFTGNGDESDTVMQERADEVKAAIQLLIEAGRARTSAKQETPNAAFAPAQTPSKEKPG